MILLRVAQAILYTEDGMLMTTGPTAKFEATSHAIVHPVAWTISPQDFIFGGKVGRAVAALEGIR